MIDNPVGTPILSWTAVRSNPASLFFLGFLAAVCLPRLIAALPRNHTHNQRNCAYFKAQRIDQRRWDPLPSTKSILILQPAVGAPSNASVAVNELTAAECIGAGVK